MKQNHFSMTYTLTQLKMNNQIFQINVEDDKVISGLVDMETGEIIDEAGAEKSLKSLPESVSRTAVAKVLNSRALQEVIKSEIERLKGLLANEEKREDNLKRLIMLGMKIKGMAKMDFGTFGAKIAKNPPRLEVGPNANLKPYTKIEMVEKVDKMAIKADLKNGKDVDGCRLVQEERIDIF